MTMSYNYSVKNGIANNGAGNNCCSRASSQLKLYQAFIFSVPIFFTFILLLLFYLFYLRRRRVDWSSLRMRTAAPPNSVPHDISTCELGLTKELREMLPIIVFKESFSVKDTQCSVCLGDYQAEDRLQQIPGCGHTFHMDCIDLWLATHTTCPLCRQSLLAVTSDGEQDSNLETNNTSCNDDQQIGLVSNEDPEGSQQPLESEDTEERVGERNTEER